MSTSRVKRTSPRIDPRIAQTVGGNGGGRCDMAQAGGTEVAKLDETLAKLYELVGASG